MTTNATIAADLRASLRLRGVPAGSTWGEFKTAAEVLGIKDSDPLACIEYGIAQTGTGLLRRNDDETGVGIVERTSDGN